MNNNSARILQSSSPRFFISLAAFVTALLFSPQNRFTYLVLTLVFSFHVAVSGLSFFYARKRTLETGWNYALVAADIIAISSAIWCTGKHTSPLCMLYLVVFGTVLYYDQMKEFVYAAVLAGCLYAAILVGSLVKQEIGFSLLLGQLGLLAMMTAVLYAMLSHVYREKEGNKRLLSQSQALSKICSLMSGPLSKPKEVIRSISQLLDQEMGAYGVHCRINIHKSGEFFIPPSGGQVAMNVPIMIGEQIGGTLMVNRKEGYVATANDTHFFSAVANAIGLYCHRAKIWEDFQAHLEKIEASLLLNASSNPKDNEKAILAGHHKEVRNMIDVVRVERGQWTIDKGALDFKALVYEEIEAGLSRQSEKNLNLVLDGNFQELPVIIGDPQKLRQLFQTILHMIVAGSPDDGKVYISVRYDQSYVTFNFEDQANAGQMGPITMSFAKIFEQSNAERQSKETLVNWGLVTCKKIVDAHKGQIWAESKGPGKGRLFSFSLPFTPDEHLNNTLKITSEVLGSFNS